MAAKTVTVMQQPWFSDMEMALEFPASWDVRVHHMKGHDRSPASPDVIRRAFANPLGTRPLRELAKGKREVAIIFDDVARPTKVSEIVPYVLEELAAAGIADEQVRFVCGLGAHGAHTRADFARKLGADIPRRFPVYNHNPHELCTRVGITSRGTPVEVNDEVLRCDLRLGIGSIVPHPLTGWGGGAKIVLPGICSLETITYNHRLTADGATARPELRPMMGRYEGNPLRMDMEEAARLAGLDLVIDALVNERRDIIDLLVGYHAAVLAEGARRGREVYATDPVDETYDVIVSNAYSKANEAGIAARTVPGLGGKQVDFVLLANCPEGQVVHYLYGAFGNDVGGRLRKRRTALPEGIRRLIVFSEYPDKAASQWWGGPELVQWQDSWGSIVAELQSMHPAGAKVAVFPDLTIQYFPVLLG